MHLVVIYVVSVEIYLPVIFLTFKLTLPVSLLYSYVLVQSGEKASASVHNMYSSITEVCGSRYSYTHWDSWAVEILQWAACYRLRRMNMYMYMVFSVLCFLWNNTRGSLFIMNSPFPFCRSSSLSTDCWPSLQHFNQLYSSVDLWAWHCTFLNSCHMSNFTQRKSSHIYSTWILKHVMRNCQTSEEFYIIFILCQNDTFQKKMNTISEKTASGEFTLHIASIVKASQNYCNWWPKWVITHCDVLRNILHSWCLTYKISFYV